MLRPRRPLTLSRLLAWERRTIAALPGLRTFLVGLVVLVLLWWLGVWPAPAGVG